MHKTRDIFYLTLGYLSGICIIGITCLIMAQILGRAFGILVPDVDKFSGYCLAASIFFGLAYTFRENGHIRVGLLIKSLPPKLRRIQESLNLVAALALAAFIAFYCCEMLYESFIFKEKSDGYFAIPVWIPQLSVAIGSIALLLAIFDSLIQVLFTGETDYMKREGEFNLEEI